MVNFLINNFQSLIEKHGINNLSNGELKAVIEILKIYKKKKRNLFSLIFSKQPHLNEVPPF